MDPVTALKHNDMLSPVCACGNLKLALPMVPPQHHVLQRLKGQLYQFKCSECYERFENHIRENRDRKMLLADLTMCRVKTMRASRRRRLIEEYV